MERMGYRRRSALPHQRRAPVRGRNRRRMGEAHHSSGRERRYGSVPRKGGSVRGGGDLISVGPRPAPVGARDDARLLQPREPDGRSGVTVLRRLLSIRHRRAMPHGPHLPNARICGDARLCSVARGTLSTEAIRLAVEALLASGEIIAIEGQVDFFPLAYWTVRTGLPGLSPSPR